MGFSNRRAEDYFTPRYQELYYPNRVHGTTPRGASRFNCTAIPAPGTSGAEIALELATTYPAFFVGMPFQFALTSAFPGGVGSDAGYVVEQIARAR